MAKSRKATEINLVLLIEIFILTFLLFRVTTDGSDGYIKLT